MSTGTTETAVDGQEASEESVSAESATKETRGAAVDDLRTGTSRWARAVAYGVLPGIAITLTVGAAVLKWRDLTARSSAAAATESVRAATESTIAMLSYQSDTVEKDLEAAQNRLTGNMKESYTSLTRDVVIPGSKQKRISAAATVPAAASVSASGNHAVALVFVDQTVTMGSDPPTNTASRVRVTLDKVDGRWLIAAFDPI